MLHLRKGDFVWLDPGAGVPIGAEVTVTKAGQLQLIDDEGKEHRINKKTEGSVRPMHPTSVRGVDDMIRLGDLNEAGLLRNLLVRHRDGLIYTYTGSILVAVNPYQLLPIYSSQYVEKYQDQRLGQLPPHVFAIADNCFFNLQRNRKSQCCVISGESGAGKTESTKLMLQFLAAVSGQHSWIQQQILEANPIMEAFGNAKTVRNDNSSRFGKYIDVSFSQSGAIEGARIDQYLLEKSRVCRQAPEERNYHIFYYMLKGLPAEKKKLLSLGNAEDYNFLTMGKCTVCDGSDDVEEFAHFSSALKILMFSDSDSWEINRLLAAILHLGNVTFKGTMAENMEGCEIQTSSTHFKMAAQLLQVDLKALEKSLSQRSLTTGRESVTKPLTSGQAVDGRDAFVKAIYGRLFIWVVHKINAVIYKPSEDSEKMPQTIGLLDIFGFENFSKNSFEQLCINFANEQLQQFFVRHVFRLEQEEYARENIVWNRISYTDNQSTLDVLAGKPMNMLALIDEESNFPKGTDTTMLQKMNQFHGKGDVYITPKNNYETEFGIRHFAGVVHYDSRGFLLKNRDALSSDLVRLVQTSSNKLLKQLFQNDLSSSSSSSSKGSANPKLTFSKPRSALSQPADSKKRIPTLSGQFRLSLESLMKTLTVCQPFFIRCIKPNDFKKPGLFDRDLCNRQLRYSGMMETIRIRKAGYPVRYTFDEFLDRYRVLLRTSVCDPKKETKVKCCESICKNILKDQGDWKTGKTKIFLKDFHDTMLELERMKNLDEKALLIQRVMRGYKYRRDFLRKRQAAVVIQKHWRGHIGRKVYKVVQLGLTRLQALIRSRRLQLQYRRQREAAVVLQAHMRGHLVRKERRRQTQAVVVLQAYTRGLLARNAIRNMRRHRFLSDREKAEEQRLLQARQKHLQDVLRQKKEREVKVESDALANQQMVDLIFGFLPSTVGGKQGQAPAGFENLDGRRMISEEIDIDDVPMGEDLPGENYDDLDEFPFSKFASIYFQGASTHSHVRQRLVQPLLHHEDQADVQASLCVWWVILRFMGDLPEPKNQIQVQRNSAQDPRNQRGNMKTQQNPKTGDDIMTGEGPTLNRPMAALEKLHIICSYGIVRRDLRDEIYCQICKQLQGNNNRNSCYRGWILLCLCLGVFPPSQRLSRYLQSFMRSAPGGYASYCAERLRRTVANGVRGEPPAWLELQATKTKKPMTVSVALMDGRSFNVPVDSASTSMEICQVLSNRVRLTDAFGFSLYVALYEKVWPLGSGGEHLMDAISQCEQEVRRRGGQEQHAPYRLCFRKEIFTPWHSCPDDPVSTELLYRQIVHGLKCGEYRCSKDEDLVQLVSKHLYVQHGSECSQEQVRRAVQECVPPSLLEARAEAKWMQMVSTEHSQGPYVKSRQEVDSVKAEMVDYAMKKWPMLFSRFYEARRLSGPPLQKNRFIVAINWTGITFLDEREKRLLDLTFPEVTGVNTSREGSASAPPTVSLLTLRGDFSLSVSAAQDLSLLLTMFLSGLTLRSQYAVALRDTHTPDDPTFLSFRKGALIHLIKDQEFNQQQGWVKGQTEGRGRTGAVPTDAILVLPTLSKPTPELMNLLNLPPNQRKNIIPTDGGTMERAAPATLKEFSIQYFRQPSRDVNRQVMSRNAAPERLWVHSREPLKQPLLQKLQGNSQLSHAACLAFTAVLKYMGDYPTKQSLNPLELTDQIFAAAAHNPALRDEVYCQIIKQMTSNNNRLSVERGWQLLWLCCGLFPPSQVLLKHARRFLESRRRETLASDCLQRLQSSLRMEPRKFPPHQVEVDAIQQNSVQIFHKIHFPNGTDEIFEVGSNTRVKDLVNNVSKKLRLTSSDGFSVFVNTQDKVLSLNESEFFFDSLRQITDWSRKAKGIQEAVAVKVGVSYSVFFMRKLWVGVVLGRDPQADLIFHFPQELPKYLSGYHVCSREETLSLAALLLRSKVGDDRSQLVQIPKILKELVPVDQLKGLSENEWKKSIMAQYLRDGSMTAEEAKLNFLKAAQKWSTFGSAFFRVKQTSEANFPDIVLIAISKQGLTIFHPKTKDVLANHPFNRIANWCSGSTYFHMTVGNLVKGSKFLCETSMGYKMDDLISSYVNMYHRERKAGPIRSQRFNM